MRDDSDHLGEEEGRESEGAAASRMAVEEKGTENRRRSREQGVLKMCGSASAEEMVA